MTGSEVFASGWASQCEEAGEIRHNISRIHLARFAHQSWRPPRPGIQSERPSAGQVSPPSLATPVHGHRSFAWLSWQVEEVGVLMASPWRCFKTAKWLCSYLLQMSSLDFDLGFLGPFPVWKTILPSFGLRFVWFRARVGPEVHLLRNPHGFGNRTVWRVRKSTGTR